MKQQANTIRLQNFHLHLFFAFFLMNAAKYGGYQQIHDLECEMKENARVLFHWNLAELGCRIQPSIPT